MQITEITIRNLKAAPKQRTYFDGALPGFGLRVSPGGTKTFVLMHGTSRQLTTLGRHGVITLAQARAKAKEILAERTLGNHRAPAVTFEEAFETFKQLHCARKKERTAKDYQRTISVHFLPKLRHERLDDITTHTLAAITDKLHDTPGEYAHALAVSRTFFRWCVSRRYLKHSPLEGVQIPKNQTRDHVLTEDELARVYRAADTYPFGTIVRLLILTGQRRGEIAALRSEWIDMDRQTITLPASLTKNSRQHTFPFGNATKLLLKDCPSFGGILFPARGASQNPFSGWSKCKIALDKASRVSGWTLHDLRRTFATSLAALGTPIHITERLLNHISGTQGGIVSVYQRHTYQKESREAIELWEKHLSKLLQ